jgi:hypothetical protein
MTFSMPAHVNRLVPLGPGEEVMAQAVNQRNPLRTRTSIPLAPSSASANGHESEIQPSGAGNAAPPTTRHTVPPSASADTRTG